MKRDALIEAIIEYIREDIYLNHKRLALHDNAILKSYKINPMLIKYLSKVIDGKLSAEGVAKALYYPRVLGTSINTSFGTKIQKMFVELHLAEGSLIKGIDIEFEDHIDKHKKYCQLKAGPNTINSEDVAPMLKKFDKVINLSRTNSNSLDINNLIVGVLYGSFDDISVHYQKIDHRHPVIVGKDFWHRLTGFDDFYTGLVDKLDQLIDDLPTDGFLDEGCKKLQAEIEHSDILKI
jgi:hypothetical protein